MTCTIGWVGRQRLYDFRDDFDPIDPNWNDVGITTIGGDPDDPTRYLTVVGGRLTLDGVTGAGYKVRRVPGLSKIFASFRFSTGTSDANSNITIGVSAKEHTTPAGFVLPTGPGLVSVHNVLSPVGRETSYYNGSLVSSPAADADPFTLNAGTDYTFQMVRNPDTGSIAVLDPDGGSETLGPNAGTARWGDTVFVEVITANLTHKIGSINYFYAVGDDTVELPSPNSIKRNGLTLNLGGEFAVSERDGRILADQLNGYGAHNTAEPVVEFTYDTSDGDVDIDGDLNGFYYVVDITVDYVKLAAGLFSWSAELVALPGRRSPLFEVSSLGALRDTGLAVTGDPWVAFPDNDAISAYSVDGGAAPTTGNVNAPGPEPLLVVASTADDHLYDGSVVYRTTTDDYRVGACRVEVTTDSGITWHPIPGDQVPDDSDGWRITNDRSRFSLVEDYIKAELYDATAETWEVQHFSLYSDIVPVLGTRVVAVTVLENNLAQVSVRATVGALDTVDFTLRRGATIVEVVVATGDGAAAPFTIFPYPAAAATAITAGAEATSANGDGNKWIVLSPLAITLDTGTGECDLTTDAALFPFGLGVSNADLITGVTATEAYFAANYPEQNVITG